MMNSEIDCKFVKQKVEETSYASKIRALGIKHDYVYMLRERIDCSQWHIVSQYFMKPTPRRYVTIQPRKVIEAMKKQGLW